MKTYQRLFIVFCCTIVLFFNFFVCYSVHVFASEGVYDPDTSWWEKFSEESSAYFSYLACRVGAVVQDHDFAKWVQTRSDYKEWWNTGHITRLEDSNGNVNYSFDKELMDYIKQCLDEFTKQNESYYMVNTLTLSDLTGNFYEGGKIAYDTAKNLLEDSPSGVIAFGFRYNSPTNMWFVDVGNDFKNVSAVNYNNNDLFVMLYDNKTWGFKSYTAYSINAGVVEEAIKTSDEFKEKASYTYNNKFMCETFRVYPFGKPPTTFPYNIMNYDSWLSLITKEPRRIRVFNTYADFQDYTLGKRHVYYTSNYYDYVPSDISVSNDELQQSVDDLSTAMDKLLEQIDEGTSESDIEYILQQILDELKNSHSGNNSGPGNNSGTSGGFIDMSTTNSWLSKIYAKLCNIFDKMPEKDDLNKGKDDPNKDSVSGNNISVSISGNSIDMSPTNSILDGIRASIDDIHETIKKIKNWSIADTVIGGADAIADWLDLVHDVLSDADNGAESVVSTLSSALGGAVGLMKTKFPFSIPWDILFFVTVLSAEPETPHFKIPFDFEISALDISVDYDLEVNFTPFQWLSDLSRLLLGMTYAVGLMKMTAEVSSINKEG